MSPACKNVVVALAIRVPLRDGTELNATVYLPQNSDASGAAVLTVTPYISDTYHEYGRYFASRGMPFVIIDCRGRGNSAGQFRPLIQEAADAYDAVEWVAHQPFCDGRVVMWGGSYAGYVQWAAAKEFPPHLVTIVPAAAAFVGLDFPMRHNVFSSYVVRWLTFTEGRTLQQNLFGDDEFWRSAFARLSKLGRPFSTLDELSGIPSSIFKEWVSHPEFDFYWQSFNPTASQYSKIRIPILTITGIYDDDQAGALEHYKRFMRHATPDSRAHHYLVIGPWDHAGTRAPKASFGGIEVGNASLIDLRNLHYEWYGWVLGTGPKPELLQANVAYYLTGADKWCYADSLESVVSYQKEFYFSSRGGATDVFSSGELTDEMQPGVVEDQYVYDPRDRDLVEVEQHVNPESLTDQRIVYVRSGRQLIYHSKSFSQDVEISGFFRFEAWLSIDQPDTDICVTIYEIDCFGGSVRLSADMIRARYRQGIEVAKLVDTTEPLRYEFSNFNFVAKLVKKGHRLRVTVGPPNSVYVQKNYNSARPVAEQSINDARVVTVGLFHSENYPTRMHVPFGRCAR